MITSRIFAAKHRHFVPMKIIFGFALFTLLASAAVGQQQTPLSSAPGQRAIMRGLDKVTATTHDFELEIGNPAIFGSLTLTLSYCRKRPPEETPEVYAFLSVLDRKTDGSGQETEGELIFNGWMFGSSPALNPLEHPVYDVWVLDCK